MLNHRTLTEGPGLPVVILHGLLGSSRNWLTVGRKTGLGGSVYALDLRNHGESFHHGEMNIPLLAGDVAEWMQAHLDQPAVLIGHSLGGKAAMRLALDHPQTVSALVVVDIVPRIYDGHHRGDIEALCKLDVHNLSDRKQADQLLAPVIPAWGLRQFLLTNLRRGEDGWEWQINLQAIHRHLADLSANPLQAGEQSNIPTLLLRGTRSDFVRRGEEALLQNHFPNLTTVAIEAGHNLHIENTPAFVEAYINWTTREGLFKDTASC